MIGRFRRAAADERGSMPMALLVTLVGMSLSAALVPLVISTFNNTRNITARTLSLQAAQAGIDVALGQLRAAALTNVKGDLESLPSCDLSGIASATSGYRVRIDYYKLAADGAPVSQGSCLPTDVPVSALLTSTGGPITTPGGAAALVPGSGNRTLQATYTFKTSNENVSGGAVQLAQASPVLCMDAGDDSFPAAGSPVKVQECKSGGSSDQRFAYTADMNLKVVGSETSGNPSGMCVDAKYPSGAGVGATHAAGTAVTFEECQGAFSGQQWGLNDSSMFQGTKQGSVQSESFCLDLTDAQSGLPNSPIVIGACSGANGEKRRIWRPQAGVGAGKSSASTGQLVNFKQFSRCLDDTNFNTSATYMIVWFCKLVNGAAPANQAWQILPAEIGPSPDPLKKRILILGRDGLPYCLKSPNVTAAGVYVTLSPCTLDGALTDAATVWTMNADTKVYRTSYTIVDNTGLCLTPTDLTATPKDTHTDGTAKVKMATCNGSELQKWNAPADLNKPIALTGTTEK